jgi:two-component system, cell cycle sensor histidine kinase and response regulator CckA
MSDNGEDREARERNSLLLAAVLDQSPVAMLVVSLPDLVLRQINRAAVEALGIEDEPSLMNLPLAQVRRRQTWRDLPADDSPAAPGSTPIERALRGERTTNVEFSVLRKDGTRRWFLGGGTPIRREDGTALAGVLAFRDVTENRMAVQELRRLANEQRTILDTVSAGICLLKADRIQWVNPAFESIFGCRADEVCGQDTARFYARDEDFQRVSREGFQALTPTSVYSTEVLLKRASGETFWCHIAGRAVDPTQMDDISIWVLQDIDSLKQVEEALRVSQARLDTAQAHAHIGSWEIGVGGETVYWSKEMYRLFDQDPSKPVPSLSDFLAMVHPDDRQALSIVDQELRATGLLRPLQYRTDPARGPERVLDATAQPVRDATGALVAITGTLQDVTERKRTEREQARLQDQLRQAAKMEAVGRLAGGVAHDFNNLLSVIQGNAELAKLELAPADPLVHYLDQVQTAGSSAVELTRQLLAFSRRQMIEPRVLNLNDLIKTLQKMLARLIGEDVTLDTLLAHDLGSVKVDPGQFDQVIVNLAVNARDAMPKGGRLLIETANVDIDQAWCALHPGLAPGRFVMMAVTDTGHGMTKEVRERIFEPFFTSKPKGRGTGLGLAMIFAVVSQSGGAIDVYSEVDHGTTFKIYIPRAEEPAERISRMSAIAELPRGTESILLVEDEGSVRDLARSFLQRQGYRVVDFPSGGDALLYAEGCHEPIELLFTDVVLPGMNGRELAERLRPLHPETAVLFASGYTEDTILRAGVMSDQFHFISKPYSLQAIAHKVREVLAKRPSAGA